VIYRNSHVFFYTFILHFYNLRNLNNEICFYDPQINEFVDLSHINSLDYFEVLKIDKLLLNKSLISGICRAIK
jgi:hypothetical protein